jgi:hypothetical protein
MKDMIMAWWQRLVEEDARKAPLRRAEAAGKMKEAARRGDLFGTTKPAISDDDTTSRGNAPRPHPSRMIDNDNL